MNMVYDENQYNIKVVSGSRSSVNALVENELKEYPKKDYGTVIVNLDETEYIKTVRIIRFNTKEVCNGKEVVFKKGVYPFDSEISL
tara:strand:- start:499 stop:756 length:258 start_codon:yes stop_codon:yes gene_type:complete